MKVEITGNAQKQLLKRSPMIKDNVLIIKYDIDGCGCVVSGISKLEELEEVTDDEVILETNPDCYKVAIEKRYDWVFDNDMTIDFDIISNSFRLTSPNQILNPRMSFIASN